jgi:osmotically-inducible protein OsmY
MPAAMDPRRLRAVLHGSTFGHAACDPAVAWIALNRAIQPTGEETTMKNLTVAAMVAIAALFSAGCAVTSGQSSTGEYVDDATITTRVKARFADDPAVAAARINVETLKGVVQLSGFAVSETERARAAQLAAAVPGVKKVSNAIEVRPPQG